MGNIDYKKILLILVEQHHHELDKIERVITDARNDDYYRFLKLPFEQIVNDKKWNAEEKERLLRIFGYEKSEYDLEYTDKYNSKKKMDAAKYMIMFNNLSGFMAYMNCFKDIELHYLNGSDIDKDDAYKHILDLINYQADKKYIKESDVIYTKVFTKEQESKFMKAALSILSKEDKKRLCSSYDKKSDDNKSIFINIINTCDIELIDEYIQYVDNISDYLSYAVSTSNIQVVKHFLDLGSDINYLNLTPLKTAIGNNDYEMFKFLLNNGSDINLPIKGESSEEAQYIRTSTPLEYAITLQDDSVYGYCYNQFSISFKGNNNKINIDILPSQHTEEQINRSKIVKLLFDKLGENKEFDATNLICTALVTQDIKNINEYIDYIIEHNMNVDINIIFSIFLDLNLEDFTNFFIIMSDFIVRYSNDLSSKANKKLFNMYLEKKFKNLVAPAFSLNHFTSTLLNNISEEDRKDIILMPYAKDIKTVISLLKLGFDINQVDKDGQNILFKLLGDRYSNDDLTGEKEKLFNFLIKVNPETNKRLIDITHRDNKNKNALFYALQNLDTKDEWIDAQRGLVRTRSSFESILADFIEILPKEEVDNEDVINVLETRMTKHWSTFGYKIEAEFVYQHHKKLMEAFRKKMIFTDKIYREIFDKLYKTSELLDSRIQVEASLDFLYETLDINTEIQKLSIDNNYNTYNRYLINTNASFEEFLCTFKKLVDDINELKLFYKQNISKRYNQDKYLEYVKNKYNVSYDDNYLSSYILKMILFGIKKYGSNKLPKILELCPEYDINTVIYEENIGVHYYEYFGEYLDGEEDPSEPMDRFIPDNVSVNFDDNDYILFTGALIHYGILTNDIELVEYLISIGANAELIIDDEDHSLDYVNSTAMENLMEAKAGLKNLGGFTNDEYKYMLNL